MSQPIKRARRAKPHASDAIIVFVVSFLNTTQLKRCRHVSRRWERHCTKQLFDNVSFHVRTDSAIEGILRHWYPCANLRLGYNIQDSHVELMSSLLLRRLDLSGCNTLSDASLLALANVKTITHLDISNCFQQTISDVGIIAVAALPTMISFSMAGCSQQGITDASFSALGKSQSLRKLNIDMCNVSEQDLQLLSQSKSMIDLRMRCTMNYDTDKNHLLALDTCPSLRIVHICRLHHNFLAERDWLVYSFSTQQHPCYYY